MVISRPKTICSRRVQYFILGLAALFWGLLIYLLFRPNTHISRLVSSFFSLDVPKGFHLIDNSFFKFYLADYLWAFSLTCWLRCIFIEEPKKTICIGVVSLTGTLYEIMQLFGVVSGTGDIWDCLLYLLAGCTVNILNI